MIAVKRLQSLFWVLIVALGALSAYLVSLRVATERNELAHVRVQIAQARSDIRYLETEFAARANMRQLEEWNAQDFRYSALPAEHYLDGERALAHLDGIQPNGPAYVAQPVMVAMVTSTEGRGGVAEEGAASPAALQIRADASTIRAAGAGGEQVERSAPRRVMLSSREGVGGMKLAPEAKSISPRPAQANASAPAGVLARKAERMALLDARLLDDRTLGDIGRRAAAENGGGGR